MSQYRVLVEHRPLASIWVDDSLIPLSFRQAQLIGYLAEMESGHSATREELTRLLWPESPDGNPNRLDQVLFELRRRCPSLLERGVRGWRINRRARIVPK